MWGGGLVRKIAVVVASRANWGRVKSVCRAIDQHPKLQLQLIVAASAVDLPIEYAPDAIIQCLADGDNTQTMTLTTGLFLLQVGNALERLKPDFIYIHGDRHEVIAPAIAATYQNLVLCHGEGGETTGTIDEKVRHAISQLADIHFPVTLLAKLNLQAMGAKNIHVVGSTALDTIKYIDLTNNRKEDYIVILHHPNTTNPEDITPMLEAINLLKMHKVWVNPNVDAGSKAMLKLIHNQEVEFVKNLPPEEFARLIYNCKCLIGNTSAGIKECCFLGVPFVHVGGRQQGREHGDNVIFVDYHQDHIYNAIQRQIEHGRYEQDLRFGDGTSGQQIAEILAEVRL